MKRARSFISIFCCSARLVHSRIFCAFSCGIIFSGAVAFIGPGNCADAACANIATPKDSAKSNAIGRCRCIYVTQRPALTKIIAKEPRVQRGCVMTTIPLWVISGYAQRKRSCPRSAKSGHWEKACRLFAGAYDRVRRLTRALARFIPGAVFAIPLSRSEALGGIAQAVLQSLPRIGFNHRTDQLQKFGGTPCQTAS